MTEEIAASVGLFNLSCGCAGRLTDRCADHPTQPFHEILLDQQMRDARPIDILDAENRHLKILLGRIAMALGAADRPFEDLPTLLRK